MPFGVSGSIAAGLAAEGVGDATAGIIASGLVDAGAGALIGGFGSALTGGSFGKGALMGGVLGGVGGVGAGLFGNLTGIGADAASGAADAASTGADASNTAIDGVGASSLPSNADIASLGSSTPAAGGDAASASNIGTAAGGAGDWSVPGASANFGAGMPAAAGLPSAGVAAPAAAPAGSSGISSWLGSPKSALQTATLLNTGLSAAQSLLHPLPKYSVANTANSVNSQNPNFNNPNLPKYTMANTAQPYSGNWYTYGLTPQQAQYNAQPVLAQKHGGMVPPRHYAVGGQVMPMAAPPSPLAAAAPGGGMPPMGGGMPPMGGAAAAPSGGKPNPLASQNGFAIGRAIGQHLKATGQLNGVKNAQDAYSIGHTLGSKMQTAATPTFTADGKVQGPGGGQDDKVPSMLSQDEYVVPADVVAHLGDGSSNAGGSALDKMVKHVRVQKAVKGFPPKAKSPLAYIK